MPTSLAGEPAPIHRFEDLLAPFAGAEKPPADHAVGAEMEKPAVDAATFAPIPYEAERGVAAVLAALAAGTHPSGPWKPERETEGGPIIALTRGLASVTLEPGGQLELSGAPFKSVHDVSAEIRAHQAELDPIAKELGLRFLGIGFHPFAKRESLPWVPKKRYAIMRDYLPTRGQRGLDMMQRTSTVQANLDYASEADAMRKMRALLALAPLVTALFANSPFVEGRRGAHLSERGAVWLDVDPDRTGLLPRLFRPGAGYADYVEWALDVPMFLVKRGDEYHRNTAQTFRQFWKEGGRFGDVELRASMADWRLHLNTLFPEVRLKHTIELRSADSQSVALAPALSALAVGLVYDETAFSALEGLLGEVTHDEIAELRPAVAVSGLRATFRGAPLVTFAERVLDVAAAGLERRALRDAAGRDERVHLAPLQALVARGQTPADALLETLAGKTDAAAIVAATTL